MTIHSWRLYYYSKTEAKAIIEKNARRMNDQAIGRCKARTGISDYREAKELGLTIDEYLNLVQ